MPGLISGQTAKKQQALHPQSKGCPQNSLSRHALQVGFKRNEIKGKQLLHNNKPILIKGVCRHEHDERRGKAITEEGMLKDIFLLKQLNFNAVRCSHYPNHVRWWAPFWCPKSICTGDEGAFEVFKWLFEYARSL